MNHKTSLDRHQTMLFNTLDEWISEDNIVRLIDALVDKVYAADPFKFAYKGLSGTGRKPYSSKDMLKLFLYGYLHRISSSRRLEAETKRNMEVKWLLGNLQPDFKTIADYRKDNKESIRHLCLSLRYFLKEEGYIEGKKITYDGTKIKACTNPDKIQTLSKLSGKLQHLEAELDKYLSQSERNDEVEGQEEELETNAGKIEESQAKIHALQVEIARLQALKSEVESTGYKDYCPNDPNAHLMKSRDGFIPAYNVQVGSDARHKMIVLAEVTNAYNDLRALEENHRKLEEQLSITPEIIEADKGYTNISQIQSIESNGETKCYIPLPENGTTQCDKEHGITFTHNKEEDTYSCSRGNTLTLVQEKSVNKGTVYRMYRAHAKTCKACPLFGICTASESGRSLRISENKEFIDDYKKRLDTSLAKELIAERKTLIEHIFGTMKRWMGKVPLLLVSMRKVQIEIDLYATAYNLKRLHNIDRMATLMQKLKGFDFSPFFYAVLSPFMRIFTLYNAIFRKIHPDRLLLAG